MILISIVSCQQLLVNTIHNVAVYSVGICHDLTSTISHNVDFDFGVVNGIWFILRANVWHLFKKKKTFALIVVQVQVKSGGGGAWINIKIN